MGSCIAEYLVTQLQHHRIAPRNSPGWSHSFIHSPTHKPSCNTASTMTEPEPPAVAALSLSDTATQSVSKATEQEINPWDVQAGVDEEGNVKQFDYVAISQKWATKLIDQPLL